MNFHEEILKLSYGCYYLGSLEMCKEYLNTLTTCDNDNKDEIWFYYYMLGFNYYKLEDCYKAVEHSNISINMLGDDLSKYNQDLWLLADCYKHINKTDLAIDRNRTICNNYKKMGYKKLRLANAFEIANLHNKVESMERILDLFIKTVEDVKVYENETYEKQ